MPGAVEGDRPRDLERPADQGEVAAVVTGIYEPRPLARPDADDPGRVCDRRGGGGALLYVITLYGFAPLWNTEIVNFTPRVPFFVSHLLFGAAAGGWVCLQLGYSGAGMRLHIRRPRLGGAT